VRALHLGLTVLLLGCPGSTPSGGSAQSRRGETPSASEVAGDTASSPPAADEALPTQAHEAGLPPSSRLFTVALGTEGPDLVLGASDSTLWARRPVAAGFEVLWASEGPGSVQQVIAGELAGEPSLFVGRGRARGNMIDFVRVDRVDPRDGKVQPLFREDSERADIAQLVMADIDGSGPTLVVGYFETKHRVAARYLRSDGSVARGPAQLMATSRIFVDLDGDGTPDEVVGRVYRDDQGTPGDLLARVGERELEIPTQKGVRALASARLADDENRAAIYFADGWAANYGTEARAKLARAHLRGDRFVVERLAESPGEYTLFSIFVVPLGGEDRIFVQGSRYLSVLERDPSGDHRLRRLLSFENGAGQGALGRGHDGSLVWYWPGDEASSATTVDLDATEPVAIAAG
jgi:hypothetical protein